MKAVKKIISLILTFTLLLSCITAVSAAGHPFSDVADGSWYEPYVQYVYENGLMNGTSDGAFSPAVKMDRAMLVTVLYRMDGSTAVSGGVPFTDVKADSYYSSALVWAFQRGIIKGTSSTEFSPQMYINREMMVTIFFRYSQYLGHAVSKLDGLASYTDAGEVASYALTALQWAVANGIITGNTDTTLLPKGTATRAECATVLKRFCEWSKNESILPVYPDQNGQTPSVPDYECTHYYSISSEKNGKLIYTCVNCSDSYEEDITVRYDASLTAPKTDTAFADEYSITVNCYADFEEESGYGYQCLIAFDKDFTDGVKETKTDYEWNNLGYAKLSYYVYTRPGTYYYKVRAYKTEGDVFVYGPWSEVGSMERADFNTKRNGQAKYTYDIYFMDNISTNVYTGTYKAIYIKTENPELSSISVTANGESVLGCVISWGGGQYYDDVEYLGISDYDEMLHKVPGGYLSMLNIDTAGKTTVEVREANAEGYVTAKSFELNVLDYETERNKWIDGVIASQTNSAMTPKEKLDAVARYLDNGQFSYLTNVDGTLVTLAAQPNGPWFETMRWDSATSPAMLAVFAERIGGFEEIHNCYGDYQRGTFEWMEYHHKIYVVYNGQKTYYTVCPLTATGDVGAVEKINFADTSKLTKIW